MKKIKYSLLIAIISFFVLPSRINGASPFMNSSISVERRTGISTCFLGNNELERGNTFKFYVVSFGGSFAPQLQCPILELNLDENVFELKSFESKYGFRLDNGKIKLEGGKLENEGFTVNVENDSTLLWAFELEVKSDAKLGDVEISGQKYRIVCADQEECKQDNTNEKHPLTDENENKDNNNSTNTTILNDTKFYVLAGLFGTVVIEMFVLIITKTKKV